MKNNEAKKQRKTKTHTNALALYIFIYQTMQKLSLLAHQEKPTPLSYLRKQNFDCSLAASLLLQNSNTTLHFLVISKRHSDEQREHQLQGLP
ncbi:hypothetical protein [uncultured Gilvimarinus sp.]|uniref:hypothetical protein n=1 Tax=uncultured Gilvimarinus sp. TaxID=1689143 RepID=UPI0030DAF6CA